MSKQIIFENSHTSFPEAPNKPGAPKPPNVNAMLKNTNYTSSIKKSSNMDDDDDEDTRDMTGRIRTEAGFEVGKLMFLTL